MQTSQHDLTDDLSADLFLFYQPFLKNLMTPTRLDHSQRVMREMGNLAALYGLDLETALTTGLLHDAAKDLPAQRQYELAQAVQFPFTHPCEQKPVYLHAIAGGALIQEQFPQLDPQISQAITAHSFMGPYAGLGTPLARCLRVADLLAPVIDWPGMQKLRQVAYAGQLEKADLLQSVWLVEYFGEISLQVHPNLFLNIETLTRQVKPGSDFFERA